MTRLMPLWLRLARQPQSSAVKTEVVGAGGESSARAVRRLLDIVVLLLLAHSLRLSQHRTETKRFANGSCLEMEIPVFTVSKCFKLYMTLGIKATLLRFNTFFGTIRNSTRKRQRNTSCTRRTSARHSTASLIATLAGYLENVSLSSLCLQTLRLMLPRVMVARAHCC